VIVHRPSINLFSIAINRERMQMFLQETTANTFNYMILGFGVILGVIVFYLISLVARFRNLNQDLELLNEIEVEECSSLSPAGRG